MAEQPPEKIQTRLLKAGEATTIAQAAALLQQGHLVVFPTDTVYGVGVDAFNDEAIERLYRVKQRPPQKGIPILLADAADLASVAAEIPAVAQTYIDRFWPGPLTLIVPRHPHLPAAVSPDDTIAVRIPGNEVARALIRGAGGAVATSSANRSGRPAAETAEAALAELAGWVAAVIDDGPSPQHTASTIVDCTRPYPVILRQGPITAADLSLAA